jgi:hypothetical protein
MFGARGVTRTPLCTLFCEQGTSAQALHPTSGVSPSVAEKPSRAAHEISAASQINASISQAWNISRGRFEIHLSPTHQNNTT